MIDSLEVIAKSWVLCNSTAWRVYYLVKLAFVSDGGHLFGALLAKLYGIPWLSSMRSRGGGSTEKRSDVACDQKHVTKSGNAGQIGCS